MKLQWNQQQHPAKVAVVVVADLAQLMLIGNQKVAVLLRLVGKALAKTVLPASVNQNKLYTHQPIRPLSSGLMQFEPTLQRW